MAQRRYFDFQSPIKSKTSAESAALASGGIGVKFGFNKVSVINSNKTFSISSAKNITITNDKNSLENIKHVLITPDGIITGETADIQLSLSDSSAFTEGAYFVLASHQYINSPDTIVPTSYTLVKGNISLISTITKSTNIDTWYSQLSSIYSGLNRSTTIIAALIEYHSSAEVSIYTPYNNNWPNDTEAINDILYDSNNLSVSGFIFDSNSNYSTKVVSDRTKFNTLFTSLGKYSYNNTLKEFLNLKIHAEAYLTNFTSESSSSVSVGSLYIKIPNSYIKDVICDKLISYSIVGNMIIYGGTPSISDDILKSDSGLSYSLTDYSKVIDNINNRYNNPRLQSFLTYDIYTEGIVIIANIANYHGLEEDWKISSDQGVFFWVDLDLLFKVK